MKSTIRPGLNQASVLERWLSRGLLLLAILINAILHLPLTVFPIARDQGLWLTAAKALTEGKVFFSDLLHFHLPGTAVAYRLALATVDDPRHATIVLSVAASTLVILGLYLLLGQTVSRGAGAWSVLIFGSLWPMNLGWWNISQKDFLTMPWIILATWLAVRARSATSRQQLQLLLAGILIGLACTFKPTALLAGGLIVGCLFFDHLFLTHPEESAQKTSAAGRRALADSFWFSLGCVLGLLPLAVYLIINGALTDAYYCMTALGSSYVMDARKPFDKILRRFVAYQHGPKFNFSWLLLGVGYFGLLVTALSQKNKKRLWLLVPAVFAFVGFILQGKGIRYHLHPWYIVMCLFAGIAFWWSVSRIRPLRGSVRSIVFSLLTVICLTGLGLSIHQSLTKFRYGKMELPAWRQEITRTEYLNRHYKHNGDHPNPGVSENLADWLRQRTTKQDKIMVWGHECQLYVLADRSYATQAPFDQLLTAKLNDANAAGWLAGQQKRFIDLLDRDAPKYFIVTTRDKTKVERLPSDRSLLLVPGLEEYLARHYLFVRNFERLRIYQRRPLPVDTNK